LVFCLLRIVKFFFRWRSSPPFGILSFPPLRDHSVLLTLPRRDETPFFFFLRCPEPHVTQCSALRNQCERPSGSQSQTTRGASPRFLAAFTSFSGTLLFRIEFSALEVFPLTTNVPKSQFFSLGTFGVWKSPAFGSDGFPLHTSQECSAGFVSSFPPRKKITDQFLILSCPAGPVPQNRLVPRKEVVLVSFFPVMPRWDGGRPYKRLFLPLCEHSLFCLPEMVLPSPII